MTRAAPIACLLLALGLASGGVAVASSPVDGAEHSITVLGPNSSDQLTTFVRARCGREHDGAFRGRAVSTDKKWKMTVSVPNFHGYDATYDIPFGTYDPDLPAVLIKPTHGDSPSFASWHTPGYDVPAFGQVTFGKKGKLMGVGFGPAMYDEGGTSAISFTGVVTCRTKKKR
jgi:hypothetical protein